MAGYASEIRTDYLARRKDALRWLRHPDLRGLGRQAYKYRPLRAAAGLVPWHRIIPFPPHLSIELTNRCNLSCRMCLRFHVETRKLGTMSLGLFRRIMEQVADAPAADVLLTGFGEPLLHPRFVECLQCAVDCGVRNLRIITAGTLLTREKADAILDAGLASVHFSIDGDSRDTYNQIRVGGDFEQTIDNVRYFLAERERRGLSLPQVTLRTIRMPETAHEIEAIKARWQSMLRETDDIWVQDLLLPEVDNRMRREDRATSGSGGKGAARGYLNPCTVLWKRLGVRWNGELEFCCAAGRRSDLGLGLRFPEVSLSDAWTHPALNRVRRLHAAGRRGSVEACRGCDNLTFNGL